MIAKEEAKEKIKQLVNDFSENPKYWDSKPEEDIKFQFIEPMFEALGWEKKEISKEPRVLKGRADYILRNGNQEVLVVEAKKTNVSLTADEGRQAVSYAYHRKIKFSVLTNFKYLRVFHALSNIRDIDRNLLKINNDYFRLRFDEFIEKFDVLWLLSKESFEKGEINKLLSSKDEKINKPIDVNILTDLLNIRKSLSTELKSKKNWLSQEDIDEIVQIIIDRLIFIRSVEDRGLEPMNYLRSLESDVQQQRTRLQLFPYLLEKFEEFDKKYDSKLFEKGLLEKEGAFSDDVLRKVILSLYFGSENNHERYLFDQIPGDLFGSIYEQYLGTILAGTEKRVKLDSTSGKRKKMGIYYTPSYIVDYIVKNTVYEYIKEKSIDEILNVKILDPACGSGSFITRAFVEVCNVIKEKLNKGEEGSKIAFKKQKENIEELNLGQKIEILKSCIYGVDLDEKAVELARLNLLLKLLEGENQETRKLLLPHLENNIKCGNSLIDDTKVSDRAFKWESEFREIMSSGGFDIVVGNPPYVNTKDLSKSHEKSKEELVRKYKSAKGCFDLYIPFIEKSITLLKEGGLLSFILPNKLLSTDYAKTMREIMFENRLLKIVDVSNLPVFKDASVYPIIFVEEKGKSKKEDKIKIMKGLDDVGNFVSKGELSKSTSISLQNKNKENFLLSKLELNSNKLGEIANVESGVTGFQAQEIKSLLTDFPNKKGEYTEFIVTKNIDPYSIVKGNLNYMKEKFSKPYLLLDSKKITKNKINMYKSEKIIVGGMTKKIEAGLDTEGLASGVSTYTIRCNNLQLILALLNSKLINYWYREKFESKHLAGGYLAINKGQLVNIPIRLPSLSQQQKIISLVEQMLELQKKYHDEKTIGNEKERLKSQIDAVDYEIDDEVYKLYEITDEEKKIVEGSLK